jgi:hypothetical protein
MTIAEEVKAKVWDAITGASAAVGLTAITKESWAERFEALTEPEKAIFEEAFNRLAVDTGWRLTSYDEMVKEAEARRNST